VLFQLDGFIEETRDEPFGVLVPVRFSKKYGASIYASVRQYVCKHHRACCVIILEPPELRAGDGFAARVRRAVTSPAFDARLGRLRWPEQVTPDDQIGALVPIGGRTFDTALHNHG
jgi:hypothetical protein